MADTQSILQLGIEAARAGEKAEARELFRLVTREDPGSTQGWLWLAGVAETRDEKRSALERVIALDPQNELARKGLNALGVAAPAADAPDPRATAKLEPAANDPVVATAATPAPRRRARVYDEPALAFAPASDPSATSLNLGTGAAAMGAAAASRSARAATPTAASATATEPRRTVPAEEELEPRRGGFGWLTWPLLLIALAVAGFFVFRSLSNNQGAVVADASPDTVASAAGASLPALGSALAEASGAAGVLVDVSAAGQASEAGAVASPAPSAVEPSLAASSAAEASAAAPSVPAASAVAVASVPAASEPVPSAAPVASEPAPSLAPEPPTAVPPTAVAAASPAAEATAVAPTAVPVPTAAPPAAGDAASANPAVVPNGTIISAGNWDFSYNGIYNFDNGPYAGAPPSRGRYEIVLITVRNTGNAAAQIPDGALVIKDAQGRVYDFNRAASVDYFNRAPARGDLAADAQIAPSGLLSSVPLLFDVSSDASNLVLFSRDNLAQGFLVR